MVISPLKFYCGSILIYLFKMNSNLSTNNNPEIADLFIGSTKWFDLIINLKTFRFSREKDESQKKNDKHRLEIPDWSITKMLVSRFEEAFGHIALICGNDFEGQKMAMEFLVNHFGRKVETFAYNLKP